MQWKPSSVSSVLTSLLKLLIPFVNTQPAALAVRHLRQVEVRCRVNSAKASFAYKHQQWWWYWDMNFQMQIQCGECVCFIPTPRVPGRVIEHKRHLFHFLDYLKQWLVYFWDLFVMSTHVNSVIKGPFKNLTVSLVIFFKGRPSSNYWLWAPACIWG